jgi:hypothetical protein
MCRYHFSFVRPSFFWLCVDIISLPSGRRFLVMSRYHFSSVRPSPLQVGAYTSDLADLVGGALKVCVRTPASPDAALDAAKLPAADAATVEHLSFPVGARLFGDRVAVLPHGAPPRAPPQLVLALRFSNSWPDQCPAFRK